LQESPIDVPFLTDDLPGIGGVIKHAPEDFRVEEIPAFELTGDGSHLYLLVEKRDVSHEQMLQHVARSLQVRRGDIGAAGMKDRRAVTRQYVSVPAAAEARLPQMETADIHVLSVTRHPTKLKTGKLRRNRFSILVRNVAEDAEQRAAAIADRLLRYGFPNAFGPQRFGTDGQTLQRGRQLLTGEIAPKELPPARRRFLLRLCLSVAQAWLFNRTLAARLRDRLHATVLCGDVMQVCASGGLFVSDDPATDQRRLDENEIAITGPLFGPKMKRPDGEPLRREQFVLQECGLSAEMFTRFPKMTSGTRRAYLIRPDRIDITPEPEGLRFEFALPAGVYATQLLREFMKVKRDENSTSDAVPGRSR